jgi:hypothetical protein
MSARHSRCTARIQRRFENWELDHLRDLAARQAEQIQELQAQLSYAEHTADFWRESHHNLEEHLDAGTADARCVGLTKSGELMVVQMGGAQ